VQPVQVGLPKAALLDLQQFGRLKLLEVGADAAIGGPHILGELDLPRKAGVIAPGVLKEHRIGELGADGDVLFGEDEIRDLGEAMTRREIGADDLNVALSEDVADVPAFCVLHARSLYVACKLTGCAYPLLYGQLAMRANEIWICKDVATSRGRSRLVATAA